MSKKHYRKEKDCLNCGHTVEDKFCSHCGQENIELKEPFWRFVSHGVGHYFHYDSKFKRTLRPFLTQPGKLTKDYMEGKRASYIPPVSLYLFITLVYFLFAPTFREKNDASDNTYRYNYKYDPNTGKTKRVNKEEKYVEDSLYDAFKESSHSRQAKQIDSLELALKEAGIDSIQRERWLDLLEDYKGLHADRTDSTVSSYRKRQAALSPGERDNFLTRFTNERYIKYKEKTGKEFKGKEVFDKYFPKLLFILMPLFAFFLMLNLRRNKKLYMEHLIFTIHLFSFAYFNFFVSEFLEYIIPNSFIDELIGLASFGLLVWYLYRSIRVVYERKRWVAVRKVFSISLLFILALSITYGAAISLFILLI